MDYIGLLSRTPDAVILARSVAVKVWAGRLADPAARVLDGPSPVGHSRYDMPPHPRGHGISGPLERARRLALPAVFDQDMPWSYRRPSEG